MKRKQPKPIVYFSVNSFLGGAEVATVNFCFSHIKNSKYKAILVVLNDGPIVKYANDRNVEVVILNSFVSFSNPLSILKAASKLRNLLLTRNIEIIHSSMAYAHILSSIATFGLDIKKVHYGHGPVDTIFDFLGSLLACDLQLFNSEYLRRKSYKFIKIKDSPERIVYPITKSFDFVERSRELMYCVSFLGRISRFKGIETIISAINTYNQTESKKINLIICGQANSLDDKKYEEELRQLGRSPYIHFVGATDKPEEIFCKSDLIIHSSVDFEPFGMVLAEAMSSGTPVILSEQCTLSTYFKKYPLLILPQCIEGRDDILVKKIKHFYNLSDQEREQISLDMKICYQSYLDSSHIITKLEALYEF